MNEAGQWIQLCPTSVSVEGRQGRFREGTPPRRIRPSIASQRMEVVPVDNPGPDHGDKLRATNWELTRVANNGDDLAGMASTLREACADYGATLTGFRRDGHALQLLFDCTPAVPLTKTVRRLRHIANRELRRARENRVCAGIDCTTTRVGRV
jgi:hypothetical protein